MDKGSLVFSRHVGIPIEDLVIAFREEVRDVLKETRGDLSEIHSDLLARFREAGALTDRDASNLTAFYGEIEAAQRGETSVQESAHTRYREMVRDTDTSELATIFARFYRALIVGEVAPEIPRFRNDDGLVVAAARPDPLTALGVNILLYGFVGYVVSGGDPVGALIGGFIGACIGACIAQGDGGGGDDD